MTFLANAVMSANLISISENRDVATAAAIMKVNKIRHLPVVNSKNELSGMISAKDIARASKSSDTVKSVMTSPVRVVKKNINVKTVIDIMLDHKISSILVASDEDIVGIVTTDDLLKLLHQLLSEHEELEDLDLSNFFDDSWSRDPLLSKSA